MNTLAPPIQLVVFTLGEYRYGLQLSDVERVVRIVDITPLPKAPDIVLGVVDVQGQVIPVINLRRRFRLPEREIDLADHLIVARTARRPLALIVDAAIGVLECSDRDVEPAREVLPGLEYVEGVAKLEDGLILIHDLDKFLSLDEQAALDGVMESG